MIIFRKTGIQRDRGSFYAVTDVPAIPYIRIGAKTGDAWQIWWYDSGKGLPGRRGGNEDLYRPGARLAGRPNVLNETAFILKKGESGRLRYNYRPPPFDDQCQSYVFHDVYMVHTDQMARDIFMRTYDYEYKQLADLSRLHACSVR